MIDSCSRSSRPSARAGPKYSSSSSDQCRHFINFISLFCLEFHDYYYLPYLYLCFCLDKYETWTCLYFHMLHKYEHETKNEFNFWPKRGRTLLTSWNWFKDSLSGGSFKANFKLFPVRLMLCYVKLLVVHFCLLFSNRITYDSFLTTFTCWYIHETHQYLWLYLHIKQSSTETLWPVQGHKYRLNNARDKR